MRKSKLTGNQVLKKACKSYLSCFPGKLVFNGYVDAAMLIRSLLNLEARDGVYSKSEAKEFLRQIIPKEHFADLVFHRPEKPPQPITTSDDFLSSYEWRSLRMKAILKFGRECMCCGATPGHGLMIHVDHIKPRKMYPELSLSLDNLQILCEVCNHGKGNWDETDWRKSA